MATARSIPLCWKWRTRRDDDKKDEMIFFSFCFFFLRREVSGSRGPNSIRHGDRNNQPGELFLFQQKFVISFFIPSKDVSFGGSVETWWTWPNRLRLRFGNGGEKKSDKKETNETTGSPARMSIQVCVCASYIQQQLYLLKQTKHNESVKTRKKNWKSKFIKEKEKQVFVCLTSASLSLVIQLHPAQAMPVGTRWRSPLSFGFAQVTRLMFSLSLFLQVVVFFILRLGAAAANTHECASGRNISQPWHFSLFSHMYRKQRERERREKRKKDVTIMNHLWKQKEKKKKRGREGSSHPLHLVGGFPVADETETKTCVYASWEKFFPFFFFFSWRRREDVIIWQQTGSTWPYSSHYIIVINFSSSSLPLSFSRETLLYATCQTVTAQKSEADALSLSQWDYHHHALLIDS